MQDYKSDQEGVRCDRVSLRCMIPDDHLLVRIHESKELDSTREFATYAGLTPKHRVFGKVLYLKIGSAKLRKALYFPAIVAKNHNPIFKQFTQKLSSKGKPTKVIIVAIMRKLLHIRLLSKLYFCW